MQLKHKPVPLNASHDYEFRKNKDERRYQVLSDTWIRQHRCTFPIEMLSAGWNLEVDFDPCQQNVTFKIPPTKGSGWNNGSINQRYKDGPTPKVEFKTYPLWSKLWTQYKIDKYEFMCSDTAEYKAMLDDINMKDLNDMLLGTAISLLNCYNKDFCSCNDCDRGTETSPYHFVECEDRITDFLFDTAEQFSVNCLPDSGYMALFPSCYRSLFLKDPAIAELWTDCCKEVPPALSGVWPNWIQNVNGVTPVFIHEAFFEKIEVEPGVFAYKIPVFHADALAYKAALIDHTTIFEDKEEDGYHFRTSFFYSMQVVHENLVRNDWIVFEKKCLPVYGA